MTLTGNFSESKFQHLWKRAKLKEKSMLFYLSCFDFRSFEDGVSSIRINEIKENRKKLLKCIKSIDNSFFNKIDEKNFIDSTSADFLLRYIISKEAREKNIDLKINNKFPDFTHEGKDYIEIKRMITTKNLPEYIKDICSQKDPLGKRCLILIFPIFDGEDADRVKDLTTGYYSLENHIKCKIEILLVTHDNMNEIMLKLIEKLRSLR